LGRANPRWHRCGISLKAVIPEETWRSVALGTPELVRDFSRLSAMVLEAVTSFFLVLVVFATAVDERGAFRAIAGFGIGSPSPSASW